MADMTPLERAARAIAEYHCEDPDAIDNVPGLAHKRLARWRRYVPVAAAVLTAIRKPAANSIDDAQAYINGARWDEVKPEAEMVWEIMIDATLSDSA